MLSVSRICWSWFILHELPLLHFCTNDSLIMSIILFFVKSIWLRCKRCFELKPYKLRLYISSMYKRSVVSFPGPRGTAVTCNFSCTARGNLKFIWITFFSLVVSLTVSVDNLSQGHSQRSILIRELVLEKIKTFVSYSFAMHHHPGKIFMFFFRTWKENSQSLPQLASYWLRLCIDNNFFCRLGYTLAELDQTCMHWRMKQIFFGHN